MKDERIEPVSFAVIKEYLRIGKNYTVISEITGITDKQVEEIDNTKYYKDYQKLQDERIIESFIDNDSIEPTKVHFHTEKSKDSFNGTDIL